MNEPLTLTGPAGPLEAAYEAADAGTAHAVLCHPHPQYGGSMHDGVLDTVGGVLLARGVDVLRFNFRGVGASAGAFAHGEGEAEDLAAAVLWLRSRAPERPLIVGGYSFGAMVAWRYATSAEAAPDRVLLVAPPVGVMTFSAEPCRAPVHLIAGDADDFVEPSAAAAFAEATGATARWLDGVDHFFMGAHAALAAAVDEALP